MHMGMTREDIFRVIDEPDYFTRGVSYFSKRKVLMSRWQGDDRIIGKATGSHGSVYSIDAMLIFGTDGGVSEVKGECTCPNGFNCKHVVAVLLDAAQMKTNESGRSKTKPAQRSEAVTNLPGSVAVWLDQFGATNTQPSHPVATNPSQDQMFFVFSRNERGAAVITPFKCYVKKDGSIGRGVQEYSSYRRDKDASITIDDAMILAQLGYYSTGLYPPSYHWPRGEALGTFLQMIVATGRAMAVTIHGPRLSWTEARSVRFEWRMNQVGDQELTAKDMDGNALLVLPFPDPVFVDSEAAVIGFVKSDLSSESINMLANAPKIPAEAVDAVSEVLTTCADNIPKPKQVLVNTITDLAPAMRLRFFGHTRKERPQLYAWCSSGLAQEVVYPCIEALVTYGDHSVSEAGSGPDIRLQKKGEISLIRRDHGEEVHLVQKLEEVAGYFGGWHPDFLNFSGRLAKPMKNAGIIFPGIADDKEESLSSLFAFMVEGVPKLRELGWSIEIDESWPLHLYDGEGHFQTVMEPSGQDWFSLGLQLDVDGTPIDITPTIAQILKALPLDLSGGLPDGFDLNSFLCDLVLYQPLPDGRLVPITGERMTGFVEAFLELQGVTRFHQAEAGRALRLVEALDGCGAKWQGGPEFVALGKRLQSLSEIPDEAIPASLHAQLRPYQRTGFAWLKALSDNGFGGVLADDMGLGKTIQTLALLASRHLETQAEHPSLIIVPTSLVANWQMEAKRFTPELKLLTLHGGDRHDKFDEITNSDLVITTYPLINRDHEKLFAHEFDLAVLDEAQTVKNPASNIAKRIRDIKARQRIALTGTPIENNLTELWALYDWLIPGLLGDRKGFAAEYRRPIEKKGDAARQKLLSSRLRPFLLRRTKDEVADDLPPKTIINEVIDLSGKQAALYESVRSAMDKRVREALAQKGLAGSHITVLDALLKLRQVCCDPRLVKLDAATRVKDSAKLTRLMEILEELMSEGRKVLVFSQFVEMLRLIEHDVQSRGWSYAMLHGQTKDRPAEMQKFQEGDASLFLISLKAGGTGLNLTVADTVILYDPWWNPAVERQAMDRAHRIGQDKPVFVYRLCTSGTVESAIQDMQSRKQALSDGLFEGTNGGPMGLTEDDLMLFFGGKPI